MNKDKEIFLKDKELIEAIWINYPENREVREESAYDKWNELYNGAEMNIKYNSLYDTLNILNVFKEFSYHNEKLCNKLVKDLFIKVREKYVIVFENKKNKFNLQNINGNTSNLDEDIIKEINNEVEEEFTIEYEKMKRIMEIFDDVSLFSQVGWDLSHFTREDMFVISKLNEIFENREEIKKLLDKIGKENKDILDNKKKNKKKYFGTHSNEVMGIKLGNDIKNLLPSELSLLHHPTLKKYFYIKYAESRLLNYDLKGPSEEAKKKKKNEHGKGPIILCVDNSSSMEGMPEELAKGSALYILKKAYKENREVYLINFGSEGEIEEFHLTNSENGLYYALKFLRKKFFGGTDFITPIKRSIELIKSEKFPNSDLMFITDGLAKVPQSFISWVESAKKSLDFKIYSLIINSKEEINYFSDKILFYKSK